MLSGDNGILQKATLSKEKTERAEIIETAQMDILAKITDKKGENITEDELVEILTSSNYNTQGRLSSEEAILDRTLTSKDGKYTIPVSEIYNGKFIKQASTTLAKDTLIVNTTASIDAKKSPYVNYPSSKGKILCRVLYNDELNGVQIVSVNSVTNLKLGVEDENLNVTGSDNNTKAINSYNRAITTLNEKAEEYKDTLGLANDARCVGSNPSNKNYPDNLTGDDRSNAMDGTDFKTDSNSQYDMNRLYEIDALYLGQETPNRERFWLASRYNGTNTMNENILQINTSASDDLEGVLYSKSFDDEYGWTMSSYSCEYGFCPVFKLNSNVIIKSGERNYGFSI